VEIWDLRRLKKCSGFSAPGSAHIEWSPDGRYVLTAILSPRLRVDNSFKIWDVAGRLLYEAKMDELYQVTFRPAKEREYTEPKLDFTPPAPAAAASPEAKPVAAQPAKYRHPHFRESATTEPIIKREGEQEGVFKYKKETQPKPPSNASPGQLSKNALRNKKKRENKKAQKAAAGDGGAGSDGDGDGDGNDEPEAPTSPKALATPATPSPQPQQPAPKVDSPKATPQQQQVSTSPKPASPSIQAKQTTGKPVDPAAAAAKEELDKKIKALNKKLKQIQLLKEQQAEGKPLDPNQMQKVQSEAAVRKEITALKAQR
jgi:translation initiation factor 2A